MLATPFEGIASIDDLLLHDDVWQLSVKADGHRRLVDTTDGIHVYNRRGEQAHRSFPLPVTAELRRLPAGVILDCEFTDDGVLHVFDVVRAGDIIGPDARLRERWTVLNALLGVWEPDPDRVRIIPTASEGEHPEFVEALIAEHLEGFVAKRWDSLYQPGLRARSWLKVKFRHDVDCVIFDAGRDGKQNFTLGMYRKGRRVEVGEVSALTGDGPRCKIGDVITVTVLSVTDSGRLYQPVKPRLRLRGSKRKLECTIDQLDPLLVNKTIPKELMLCLNPSRAAVVTATSTSPGSTGRRASASSRG